MKRILLLMPLILSCFIAEANKCEKAPIRIAIIDTGFGLKDAGHDAHLCKYGHKDFSSDQKFTKNYATLAPIPQDVHGHGTNIAGIIDTYAQMAHVNYCLVIIKFFSDSQSGAENLLATIKAVEYAANIHADYINYSGGGPETNRSEKAAVKRFLDQGGRIVAAAGNEGENLDDLKNAYYPAMYDSRIIVVGNLGRNGVRLYSSNYGKVVKRWEIGEDVYGFGVTMTGTSQATAVATGKIIAESTNKCDIGL